MNNDVARAFVLSRVDAGQLRHLHLIEKREGYPMPPWWIHERYRTAPWGDVPEAAQAAVAPTVMGITEQMQAQAKAKGFFPGVEHQHAIDLEIKRRPLEFVSNKGAGTAREKILRGQRPFREQED